MNPTRAATAALTAAIALAGCSSGTTIDPGSSRATVYVSAPLRGASGADGQDVADGARLALADAEGKVGALPVRAVYMDDTAGSGATAEWSAAQVGANARRATQDTSAIAYVGDFEAGATRTSEPITNEAQLLQVSPASTAVDLTRPFLGSQELPEVEKNSNERTFGRVIPDDEAQARGAAQLTSSLGVKTVLMLPADGPYAKTVADAYRAALSGVTVGRHAGDAGFYPGVGAPALELNKRLPSAKPLIGTDGVLPPWAPPSAVRDFSHLTAAAQAPSQLPAAGQEFVRSFTRRFHRSPGPYAAYGYEAMALVLDCVERAGNEGDSRQAVIDQFFDTVDRASILGDYSIDAVGDTTLDRLGSYEVRAGRPVPTASALTLR